MKIFLVEELLIFLSVEFCVNYGECCRYIRSDEGDDGVKTHVPPFYNGNSIQEFLDLCGSGSSLPCPIVNAVDVEEAQRYLDDAKAKVKWAQEFHAREGEHTFRLVIEVFMFILPLFGGIYLLAIGHLDWRQFGHEIVSDGSFGFDMRIINPMGFRIVPISSKEYEKLIEEKLLTALETEEIEPIEGNNENNERRSTSISDNIRKKTKMMTKEELHDLENARRHLRIQEIKRIQFEEALMEEQLRKIGNDTKHVEKEVYFNQLKDKFPMKPPESLWKL